MKAVAADSLVAEAAWQGNSLRDRRLRLVKCRVEAGDLREGRRHLCDGPHGRHVVRLVQRRQRDQRLQLRHDRSVDPRRRGELRAAMDDPVANRDDAMAGEGTALTPRQEKLDRALMTEVGASRPRLLGDQVRAVAHGEARRGRQPFDLAAQQRARRVFVEEDRELQAR